VVVENVGCVFTQANDAFGALPSHPRTVEPGTSRALGDGHVPGALGRDLKAGGRNAADGASWLSLLKTQSAVMPVWVFFGQGLTGESLSSPNAACDSGGTQSRKRFEV